MVHLQSLVHRASKQDDTTMYACANRHRMAKCTVCPQAQPSVKCVLIDVIATSVNDSKIK